MKFVCNVLLVVLVLMMVGCGPSGEEIANTVANEVAMQVQATIEALPSVTPVDTATPLATFTPPATHTPYPTFTPMPTFTPQPTYTPLPTFEPTPEDTATAVPPATSAPAIQPTAPPATTNLTIMKTELAKMLNGLDRYRGLLVRQRQGDLISSDRYKDIDCNESIASRNIVISTIPLDVSQDIPEVQSAYAVYLDVAQRFGASTEELNQVCLEAIANGATEKGIDPFQRELRTIEIGDYLSTINSINNQLIALEQ